MATLRPASLMEFSMTGCSSCRFQPVLGNIYPQQRRNGRGQHLNVGRHSNYGASCRTSSFGHTSLSQTEKSNFDGGLGDNNRERSIVSARAIPTEVSAVVALVAVAGSVYALLQLNKDKVQAWQSRENCVTCSGSGVCPTCNGEGFNLKELSPEAAAKARANAKDAATRYTAGLAKKWNYCQTCQGGRVCPECQGRGWLM